MRLFDTSITFIYRNGSEFTEHYAKPLNVSQLADKVIAAEIRVSKESNIEKALLHVK